MGARSRIVQSGQKRVDDFVALRRHASSGGGGGCCLPLEPRLLARRHRFLTFPERDDEPLARLAVDEPVDGLEPAVLLDARLDLLSRANDPPLQLLRSSLPGADTREVHDASGLTGRSCRARRLRCSTCSWLRIYLKAEASRPTAAATASPRRR